ncbi:MAG: hypothetical protein B7Y39_04530 [Bdellovibrio sp. 28-41-41]|nr:MAG: hypothetical protein B7Y39_04530 [Bdellovibrio sp. 28-41-41]
MSFVNYFISIQIFFLAAITRAQGLDFGQQDSADVVSPESLFPFANMTLIIFSIYLVCGITLLAYFLLKNRPKWVPPVILENFPTSAKVAITLTLIAYGLVHFFALLEVYLVTKTSFKSASEYFFYMKLPKLAATSHAHFFGHGTMYLLTSLIFIFSKLNEFWKIAFICLALSAGLLDVPSWWAIKYGGGGYELFSSFAGAMSVLGWGYMAIRILYEIWWSELFRRNA